MRRGHAAALVACLAGLCAAAPTGAVCELVLRDHRSGTELQRLPLDPQAPELRIAFVHSVLGTPVIDRYRFTPQAQLVEEVFEGEGYGLPYTAGPGETLTRAGAGWRLQLDRSVHPLVVRPLPQQRMRLLLPHREWLLGEISTRAIEFQAQGCPAPASP
jgi:hypothetical protein